jgi:hypothetical protein
MPLRINRRLFDRIKSAIAETMRVDMLYWAKVEGLEAVTSVSEIRALPLPSDCWAVACIGGWACFLATDEEIASAIEAYGLSLDVDDPFTLASHCCLAALTISMRWRMPASRSSLANGFALSPMLIPIPEQQKCGFKRCFGAWTTGQRRSSCKDVIYEYDGGRKAICGDRLACYSRSHSDRRYFQTLLLQESYMSADWQTPMP